MLPRRRQARVGTPCAVSSAVRFPGVAIYLAEPRMGRSRRAFLTRLALSKGFCVLDAYRCVSAAGRPPGARPAAGGGAGCLGAGLAARGGACCLGAGPATRRGHLKKD